MSQSCWRWVLISVLKPVMREKVTSMLAIGMARIVATTARAI